MITDIRIDFAEVSSKICKAIEKRKDLFFADEKTILQEIYNQYQPKEGIDKERLELYRRIFCEFYKKRCEELSSYCSLDEENFDIRAVNMLEREGKIFSLGVFNIFRKQLFLEKGLQNKNNGLEDAIIENLIYNLGNSYYFEFNTDTLEQLFENAVMLYLCEKRSWHLKDGEIESISKSMKRILAVNDYEYKIEYGDIYFSDDANEQIQSKIENMIRCIGGITFLQLLFSREIFQQYNRVLERFLIHRNKKSTINNIGEIRVPYNYLIQMAIKHIGESHCLIFTRNGFECLYNQVIQLSSDYFNVLNLQGYTIFEDMIFDYRNIPVKLSKNILFEKMFAPTQYHPEFVKRFIRDVYMPLFCGENELGYTASDFFKVSNFILDEKAVCSVYSFDEIRRNVNISHSALDKILNDISIGYNEVNFRFNNFLAETNYRTKPLVKLPNGTYFLYSAFFNGFSLCEVLYDKLNPYYPKVFNYIKGKNVENMVKNLFIEKGFEFHSGKYHVRNGETYECDIVLETDKEILFLEVKNQPLPDSFEQGDDVETLRCLGEGMIKAQRQCFRHIYYMQNRGYLELEDNGDWYKLEQKNRRIICVSISSQGYLFLTNKTFSSSFLESLLMANYHATDVAKKKRLDSLNKLREELVSLIQKIYKEAELKQVFFNTLFRSAQQVFAILRQSSNLEEFVDYLTQPICISDGSGDAYSQLLSSINMKKVRNTKVVIPHETES